MEADFRKMTTSVTGPRSHSEAEAAVETRSPLDSVLASSVRNPPHKTELSGLPTKNRAVRSRVTTAKAQIGLPSQR